MRLFRHVTPSLFTSDVSVAEHFVLLRECGYPWWFAALPTWAITMWIARRIA